MEPGRRLEDHNDESPNTLVGYRLGVLEHAFKNFENQLDTKLSAAEDKMDLRLKRFEDKLEDAGLTHAQIVLQDHRINELEKWRNRLITAVTTIGTGLILLLLTQIIVLAINSNFGGR